MRELFPTRGIEPSQRIGIGAGAIDIRSIPVSLADDRQITAGNGSTTPIPMALSFCKGK